MPDQDTQEIKINPTELKIFSKRLDKVFVHFTQLQIKYNKTRHPVWNKVSNLLCDTISTVDVEIIEFPGNEPL